MRSRSTNVSRVLAWAGACAASSAVLAQTSVQWAGGTGVWSNAGLWSPMVVPFGGSFGAVVQAPGVYTLTLDQPVVLGRLDIFNAGSTLDIGAGHALILGTTSFTSGMENAGVVRVNPLQQPSVTQVRLVQNSSFVGAGLLRLEASAQSQDSALISTDDGVTLTHGPLHTLAGAGRIDARIVNQGLIVADRPGRTLALTGRVSGPGLVRASGGVLELAQGASIAGNTISADAGGVIRVRDAATLDSATLNTSLDIAPGARLEIVPGATVGGSPGMVINPAGAAAITEVEALGPLSLVGSSAGVVRLNASPADLETARLLGGPITLTNMSVRGRGRVYASLAGTPSAVADVPGGTLEILGSANMTGGGSLSAAAGAILGIGDVAEISGGVVRGDSSGVARVLADSSPRFAGVTLEGNVEVARGARLRVSSGLTNNAVTVVNPLGAADFGGLRLAGSLTIDGNGTLILGGVSDARSAAIDASGPFTLTNGAAHTIRGGGRISVATTNLGTLIASGLGAPLDLRADVTQSGAGSLLAENATVLLGDGMTLRGGVFESFGTGRLAVAANDIGGVRDLESRGLMQVLTGAQLRLMGGTGLTNNGLMIVNALGDPVTSRLHAEVSSTLGGTGLVRLNASTTNPDSAIISSAPGAVLRIASPQQVTGNGRLYATIANESEIVAGVAGQALDILGPVTQSASGRLRAGAGRLGLRSGGSVTGGEIDRVGSGRFTVEGVASVASLRVNAPVDVVAGSTLSVQSVVNDSEIVVNPSASTNATTLRFDGAQTLGGNGTVRLNAPGLSATQARIESGPGLTTLGPGQTLRGQGAVAGPVRVEGLIAPGLAPATTGTISFLNAPELTPTTGVRIKLASGVLYDRLTMAQAYTLEGELSVTLVGAFNPVGTNVFTIVDGATGATRTGGFTSFSLPTPPPSSVERRWRLSYTPEDVSLRLTCRADFNADGLVDLEDFLYFAYAYTEFLCPTPGSEQFPLQPEPCPADLTDDGQVDNDDFVPFVDAYLLLLCQ